MTSARVPLEGDPDREPVTIGPIVGADGFGYILVTKGMEITLRRLSRDGQVASTLLAARADGGAVAQNAAGDQAHFDGTGQLLGTTPAVGLRNPVHESGGWIGASGSAPNTPSGLRKVEGTVEDATYFNVRYAPRLWTGAEQYGFGNRANQAAPPVVHKISVKCRPVAEEFPISFFYHCYIVVKNQDDSLQTIEGGEVRGQPTGTLDALTKAGDAVSPNKTTDPVYYVSDATPDPAVINCLKTNTDIFRAMHLDYHFLGPNSNRFVVEVMASCGRTVKLPWRAIGATVPFNPPQ